jgi:hypothetical protein
MVVRGRSPPLYTLVHTASREDISMRTWTLDERITAHEAIGHITMPFTPDERGLAQSLAEAHLFLYFLEEMPARCPDESAALSALDIGIIHVCTLREGRGTDQSRKEAPQIKERR